MGEPAGVGGELSLKAWQALDLPAGIERQVHQNRLLKIAREGGQMTPADLAKFDKPTLVIHGDDDQIVPIDASARAA
eukprot:gene6078-8056_t